MKTRIQLERRYKAVRGFKYRGYRIEMAKGVAKRFPYTVGLKPYGATAKRVSRYFKGLARGLVAPCMYGAYKPTKADGKIAMLYLRGYMKKPFRFTYRHHVS